MKSAGLDRCVLTRGQVTRPAGGAALERLVSLFQVSQMWKNDLETFVFRLEKLQSAASRDNARRDGDASQEVGDSEDELKKVLTVPRTRRDNKSTERGRQDEQTVRRRDERRETSRRQAGRTEP